MTDGGAPATIVMSVTATSAVARLHGGCADRAAATMSAFSVSSNDLPKSRWNEMPVRLCDEPAFSWKRASITTAIPDPAPPPRPPAPPLPPPPPTSATQKMNSRATAAASP